MLCDRNFCYIGRSYMYKWYIFFFWYFKMIRDSVILIKVFFLFACFFKKDFIIVVLICVTYFESFTGCVLCTFPVIESFCISKFILKKNLFVRFLSILVCLLIQSHYNLICTYCITSCCICCLKLCNYFEFQLLQTNSTTPNQNETNDKIYVGVITFIALGGSKRILFFFFFKAAQLSG